MYLQSLDEFFVESPCHLRSAGISASSSWQRLQLRDDASSWAYRRLLRRPRWKRSEVPRSSDECKRACRPSLPDHGGVRAKPQCSHQRAARRRLSTWNCLLKQTPTHVWVRSRPSPSRVAAHDALRSQDVLVAPNYPCALHARQSRQRLRKDLWRTSCAVSGCFLFGNRVAKAYTTDLALDSYRSGPPASPWAPRNSAGHTAQEKRARRKNVPKTVVPNALSWS